jgi:hypothetical protein
MKYYRVLVIQGHCTHFEHNTYTSLHVFVVFFRIPSFFPPKNMSASTTMSLLAAWPNVIVAHVRFTHVTDAPQHPPG